MRNAILLFLLVSAASAAGPSYYPLRLDDSKAVYVTRGDDVADETARLQAAIDKLQETNGEGIVFVPEGRYRITRTLYVWPGIRVIGYGGKRPVFVLPDSTPGFQQGIGTMVFFAGFRLNGPMRGFRLPPSPPGTVPHNDSIADANPGTFYSAMSNIDFEIGKDNAAAVAVRFHAAQHAYLAHMDFHLGSGLAGIHDVGNVGFDLHFYGGRYGILTRKPSPAWQYSIIDSTFEGQREAAIRENEAQLTVIHCEFMNVPTAIAIDEHYSDQLWVKSTRMENISGPAVLIGNENSRLTQINMEDVWCSGVPVFAKFRESGKQLAGPASAYRVKTLSHGLTLAAMGAVGETKTSFDAAAVPALPELKNALATLPPMDTWVNLRSLGLKGDGTTDETAALQKAVNEHRVLYIPSGHYVVSDTITLRPDSVIIGLHPDETQIDLLDGTAGFQGPGAARPLLLAPKGGTNIVTGIGLYTGGLNTRAVGAMWMAGEQSMMDDVRFLGGHGTRGPNGKRENPYNVNLSGDPDPKRKWDSQYPSLWITHGGGGTFNDIWTPSTFAQNGLYISDTKTPGRVYQLSSEHHVRTEVKLDGVENWELYALQTEGERGESESASSLEISRSKHITIANFHGYRVVRGYRPFPYAIRLSDSSDIRFRNIHVDSNSAAGYCPPTGDCKQIVRSSKFSYGTCIWDPDTKQEVRDREFAVLTATTGRSAPVVSSARVEKVADGFYNAGGAAVDGQGQVYFTDPHWHRIYRYSPETKKLTIVRDAPLDPVNLAFDKSGNLLVTSSGGSTMAVYSFRPDDPEDKVTVLEREPLSAQDGRVAVLPVNYWVNADFTRPLNTKTYEYVTLDQMFRKLMTTPKAYQYVSPDRSVFIPSDEVYVAGPPHLGYKWAYILQASNLVQAMPGRPFYVTNESEQRTYRGEVKADGTLAGLALFAEQGGESLATDDRGNVYMAAGQIYVYSPAGKRIEVIAVPERPLSIVFGGKDRKTLFMVTQSSLYAVRRP